MPSPTSAPIAVTGATGGIGGRVARLLADRGCAQRLVVREPSRAPRLPGAETVTGDYTDPVGLGHALRNAKVLFMVSGPEARSRVDMHAQVIDAAVGAGVERIVYTSFLNAAPDATFTFARDHAATEALLRESGLAWVALRNSMYQDILPHFVGDDRVIRGPAGEGRVSFVARDDIAAVAVATLIDDPRPSGTVDVTGPEALGFASAARILREVTGTAIRYQPETWEEAWASRASTGAPDWEIEGWVTSYLAATTGELETVTDTVERFTGTPAVTFRTWLTDNPSAWSQLRGSSGTGSGSGW